MVYLLTDFGIPDIWNSFAYKRDDTHQGSSFLYADYEMES